MLARVLFLSALASLSAACAKPSAREVDARGADDAGIRASIASTAEDAATGPPDANVVERQEASTDPAAGELALRHALAGEGETGVFWKPVKGDFPDEDLLLLPDGHYFTHFNDHPGSSGGWHVEGETLTLDTWLGERDGKWVVRGARVLGDGQELRGEVNGAPLVMRRIDPRRTRR